MPVDHWDPTAPKEQALLGHCRSHVRSLFSLVEGQQQRARLRVEERQAARRLKCLKEAFLSAQGVYQQSRHRRLEADRPAVCSMGPSFQEFRFQGSLLVWHSLSIP